MPVLLLKERTFSLLDPTGKKNPPAVAVNPLPSLLGCFDVYQKL